ncbi:MAG: preprotein translocase subunit SecA [Firmicutes bacterium]|nr:preprotein translocase subunit SecA [Bacillota bacterium]
MGIFSLFGDKNERDVKKLRATAMKIDALSERMEKLSDDELKAMTGKFKARLAAGETTDDILVEAFAVAREAAWRVLGMKPFIVQLIGGIVLHQGRIAEMRTGEGKTLVATLPAYLNALEGKGVHVVTVNEYLASFHSHWMGKLYNFLGLSVGTIVSQMSPEEKRAAYNCDITYGTNSEFGFDYLRDNMVIYDKERVQRDLHYAIVDEVDSILIDEARTPLIISGPGEKSTEMYNITDRAVNRFKQDEDFILDEKAKTVQLTETGVAKCEKAFGVENLSDPENQEINHHILQALKANFLFKKDRDYVVKDGEVLIVDEFTGRILIGRRYSEGLHQAIEAKEHVKVARENKTLATITYQNYFRMYKKLSGMTGTAKTEEEEFNGIYNLDVVCIPTNKPMIRKDLNDAVFKTFNGKCKAVVNEVIKAHENGQPVLVGTVSVESSEVFSNLLKKAGIKHEVLNAKHHAKEAEIVAQAGRLGAVTIATNMAGRGTDILLGGNPDFLARKELAKHGYEDEVIELAVGHQDTDDENVLACREEYRQYYTQFKKHTDEEHDKVVQVGGLYIIGTERHESRRIDNQLRGRAGRQGDPGASRFFLSLQDDLMRLFGGERMNAIVDRLGLDEDQPIEAGILSKQIEAAQKKVEGRNFEIRKHVLQYDDVMNKQRGIIYEQRRKVLAGENIHDYIMDMLDTSIKKLTDYYCSHDNSSNTESFYHELCTLCFDKTNITPDMLQGDKNEVNARLTELAHKRYAAREAEIEQTGLDMREIERIVLLRSIDSHWKEHIDAMDQLRQGISLRSYGNRNPVTEYQIEGFEMFDEMVEGIRGDTVRGLSYLNVKREPMERERVNKPMYTNAPSEENKKAPVKVGAKIGRNDPCPCGSGKKYKNCCGS